MSVPSRQQQRALRLLLKFWSNWPSVACTALGFLAGGGDLALTRYLCAWLDALKIVKSTLITILTDAPGSC